MKIDYVIISSDDNPMYKDFYPIVAKRWLDLGIKTYYLNISDTDEIIENEYGIIHKIKALDFVSTGFQSQVVRLFSSKFVSGNMLISDIDMLPINGNYYNQYLNELTDNNVIIYSGQPYGDVPYYPICYVLSNSKNISLFCFKRRVRKNKKDAATIWARVTSSSRTLSLIRCIQEYNYVLKFQ